MISAIVFRGAPTGRRAVFIALVGALACSPAYPPPPDTFRDNVTDTIHGVVIPDPYRWLEDQDSPETRAWIDAQNAYAQEIVPDSPLRARIRTRLHELMEVENIGNPSRGGDYEFFTLRRRGQELPVIYRRPAPENGERVPIDPTVEYDVVIDPHDMSAGHTTRVSIQSVSSDGRHLIYSVRDGGQDEQEVRIRDVETGEDLSERLPNALYSSIAFDADGEGFYYSRRSRETGARIMYHELGTDVADDAELFGDGYGPKSFVSMSRAEDGRYEIFTVQHGWRSNEIHVRDTHAGEAIRPIVSDLDGLSYPRFIDGTLHVRTNLGAPNYRVVTVDLSNPSPEHWRDVIPEGDDVLQNFTVIDDKLYVTYLHDVTTQIRIYEKDGTPAGELETPEYHTANIRGAGEGRAHLTLNSFVTPPITYEIDLETGEREVWQERSVDFDRDGIVVKQVWYQSKDGTRAPMYVVHRDDVVLDGNNPTLLGGYGGFNVSITPSFSAMGAAWVEEGGVYASATLRGGSEFGEAWHRAGMLENKQNVFDDFIAAAEWLIENDYTSPSRLAIRGGSNGGLLVASAFTQRPELYRAVLCGFPDLDMVRFYTFTETNNMPALLEYGDASIPEQFEFIRQYSPYQKVREGVDYPAVMFTTGDLDTRVPPLQARKMAARVQEATSSGLPVILHYDEKAGHAGGRGRPFSRAVDDTAMELTFLLTQLGADPNQ